MTGAPSFHDLTITVRVQVLDPAEVLSDPSAMYLQVGCDGEIAVHLPGSVEEAVLSRFTAMLDHMYRPSRGLVVCEHSEQLTTWRRSQSAQSPPTGLADC